ncbi:NAD(P)H-hydrate dehydratase [Marinospirillum perlucidum]|uniref:NAD(P)H-hydrate dehydratase n=1 Tax=Marinospirillum perlucidum TaxID=1982602 RepID=UPI000DF232A4|nr:NAD(P)H-hydrate dehydratase [Marinospirillum perlucidum]
MLIDPRRQSPADPSAAWPLYSAASAAAIDQQVIAAGTPGFELMQRAAKAAWQLLRQRWPKAERISVFCGGGNNGGDGLLLALLAQEAGKTVRLWITGDPSAYIGEAAEAWAAVQAAGLQPEAGEPELLDQDEVLVDALLGIGLQGEVRGRIKEWIEILNASSTPILALDTPSGLLVDEGAVAGCAVKAQLTLTFIVLKPGLFTGQGPAFAGRVFWADLSITQEQIEEEPLAWLQAREEGQKLLKPRQADGHKVSHGRLLIVAGQTGMGGAALLAAQAALRSGAGMVKLLTAADNVMPVLVSQPELLVEAWQQDPEALTEQLEENFRWADALLIGPGLGQGAVAQHLWETSWLFSGPCLVDADALNLCAAGVKPSAQLATDNWVITPHPGEAARLLGWSGAEIQKNRLQAVRLLALQTGAVSLLKGAGSCCQRPDEITGESYLPLICPFGNAGMGVAGMGDLLSGCIAALLAQGLHASQAAALGMRIHAQAGDKAAGDQPRGLLPSDLLPFLREGVN